MKKTIKATYEKGVLRPSRKLSLPEHKEVTIRLVEPEDTSAHDISSLAAKSQSYDFLKRKGEDIYTLKDGRPV